jgi:hypothetical protein
VEAVQQETGDTDGKEALLIEEEDIEDPGGNDTFLAWFFRGEGPKGLLSGASFRNNRLMGTGSAYATFFEDNHIAALLDNVEDAFQALASTLGLSTSDCSRRLRELAYATYQRATK